MLLGPGDGLFVDLVQQVRGGGVADLRQALSNAVLGDGRQHGFQVRAEFGPVDVAGLQEFPGLGVAHLGHLVGSGRHGGMEGGGDHRHLGLEEGHDGLLDLAFELGHGLPVAVDGLDFLDGLGQLGSGRRRGGLGRLDNLGRFLTGRDRPGRRHRLGRGIRQRLQPAVLPTLVDRAHAAEDVDLVPLALYQGLQTLLIAPDELQVGGAEAIPEDPVHQGLDPHHDRRQALGQGRLLDVLGGRAVGLLDQGSGGDAEREADDAGQPLVIVVLEGVLLRVDGLDLARDEHGPLALLAVAGHERVPPALERLDVVGIPLLGHAENEVGGVAVGIVAQLMQLPAQGDVDGGDDLLYGAEAKRPVSPGVARHVEQLLAGVLAGRHALDHLLVGGAVQGSPAGRVQDPLDGGAVDQFEGEQAAAPGAPLVDRRGVQDEQILGEHANPGAEWVLQVGVGQEILDLLDPRVGAVLLGGLHSPLLDVPGELLNLILAGLDDQAQQVVAVGDGPQLGEGHAFVGLGLNLDVVAGREVVGPADAEVLGHGLQRVARPEPLVGAVADAERPEAAILGGRGKARGHQGRPACCSIKRSILASRRSSFRSVFSRTSLSSRSCRVSVDCRLTMASSFRVWRWSWCST